jgi:hypothetical protein
LSITVLNTDAGLSGKTIVNAEDGQTVTGLKTFDRDPNPPFAVTSGSAAVANLDADKLDGLDSLAFVKADGTVAMTGALTMTSGQIVFPATQVPSAGVNTLDDYEEGSWTPVIGGSGGTSGQAYSIQVGSYVKIGKLVIAQFAAVLSTKGTITTSVQIQGLPFTSENTTNLFSVGAVRWGSLATTWASIIALISPNATVADIQGTTVAAAGNNVGLTTADLGNTSQFIGTIVYRATA